MALVYPTSILAANVLDGIADATAILRSPQADNPEADRTVTFDTGIFNPPLLHFDPVVTRSREFRNHDIDYQFVVRARIVFRLPFLDATEAAKWRGLWNDYMAGYKIYMRPHSDNGLALEWQVCPTPGTAMLLAYFADKYIGHTTELSFTAISTQSAMNLKSSAVEFNPIVR